MKARIQNFLLFLLVICQFACGGGSTEGSSADGTTTSVAAIPGGVNPIPNNDPGLTPLPEPSNEIPFNLPDNFLISECPDVAGITNIRNLKVELTSPNAQTHTYLSPNDALLIKATPDPLTPPNPLAIIHVIVKTLDGTSIQTATVDFPSGENRILVGQMTDATNTPLTDLGQNPANVFGDDILQGNFTDDPNGDPVFEQIYMPANVFESFEFGFNKPGAYLFTAFIRLIGGTQVCSQLQSNMWVLSCPLAGFCDADANPI